MSKHHRHEHRAQPAHRRHHHHHHHFNPKKDFNLEQRWLRYKGEQFSWNKLDHEGNPKHLRRIEYVTEVVDARTGEPSDPYPVEHHLSSEQRVEVVKCFHLGVKARLQQDQEKQREQERLKHQEKAEASSPSSAKVIKPDKHGRTKYVSTNGKNFFWMGHHIMRDGKLRVDYGWKKFYTLEGKYKQAYLESCARLLRQAGYKVGEPPWKAE
jgi:hypothetical protein